MGSLGAMAAGEFNRAFAYAREAHAGQLRKGTPIPYVSHLLAVAALVLEDGGTETEAMAALLHDAAEDRGGEERLREIRERFGDDVARIVIECSDTTEQPKPAWHERKRAYIQHLQTEVSDSAVRVSLADKLHNARAMLLDYREHGDALWERFNAPAADQLWYYRALADAFTARTPSRLAAELDRTVTELEVLVNESGRASA